MVIDAATQRTPALAAVPTDPAPPTLTPVPTPVPEPDGSGAGLALVRSRHPANGLRAVRAGPGAPGDAVAAALCVLALRLEVATVETERLLDRTLLKRRSPVGDLRSEAEPVPMPRSRPPGLTPPPSRGLRRLSRTRHRPGRAGTGDRGHGEPRRVRSARPRAARPSHSTTQRGRTFTRRLRAA